MEIFISQLRALFRIFLFAVVISLYFVVASGIYILNFDPILRRRKLILNTRFFSRLLMQAFNVHLVCKNIIPEDEVSLVVGNHMGFIDVVALQTLVPSVFITSQDMRETPVLGQISELAGCAYVDRNNRSNIQKELDGIIQILKQNFRVALYPEAKASDGEQVLPFKKTLLMSAAYADCPVRPYAFNFRQVNGRPVTYQDRDSLCWYGDQTFQEAIWRSLKLKSMLCEIEFLPLMYFKPTDDRTFVAESVQKVITDKFIPFKK